MKQCRRCGKALTGRQRSWCSETCGLEWMALKWMSVQGPRVARRDAYRCQLCGWRILRSLNRVKAKARACGSDLDVWKAARAFHARYGAGPGSSHLWEVDHIRPRKKGGTNDKGNLRTLCIRCHRRVTAEQAAERARARREG